MPTILRRPWKPLALAAAALAGIVVDAGIEPLRAQSPPALRPRRFALTEEDRRYWAFQPVTRPAVPEVPPAAGETVPPHPVDAFLRARLAEHGLAPSPSATPRELVRRAHFDLLGLPPSPEAVEAFERDPSDAAWEALIDRLLASPQYGERWGRHWLDLVRFAESNGYERDGAKPQAWRYRDYVIRAFNADKPYDRFIREQLAGDELVEDLAPGGPAWRDAIVATGFFRLHVWDDEPDSTLAAEFDDLDDILVTTGTAFLGLTVGCARCHDHKFDPLSQADYYSLLAFVRNIDPYGQHHTGGGGRGTGRIERPLAAPAELRRWEQERRQRVQELETRVAAAAAGESRNGLEAELKQAREARPPFDFALAIAENGPRSQPTHVLARGDVQTPREEVVPAFPVVFGRTAPALPERAVDAPTTGRRRVLADWVAGRDHPLTARVLVNRLWQRHFGVGIVPTPDDFGRTGTPPTHPALLDFLAAEFVDGGWRIKRMHRLIMTSRAYRMSSRNDPGPARTMDEGNTLLWRQNLRRLEAEAIRDTVLAVSGTLNPKAGGPSVFPTLPREVHGTQDAAGKGWTDSPPEEQLRRSVYLVVKRALKIPLLECFDFANSASPAGLRPVTTTAPQGLTMLNDAFVQAQGEALAGRLEREAGPDVDGRLDRAFRVVFQRPPTAVERERAREFLDDQRRRGATEGALRPDDAAWASLARALLNASETIYVD